MSRYIFDVHDDGHAYWAEEPLACEGREEIERIARHLLDEAHLRQLMRATPDPITSVVVTREGGGVVLNIRSRGGRAVQVIWGPPS